jgi:hypothetical protein
MNKDKIQEAFMKLANAHNETGALVETLNNSYERKTIALKEFKAVLARETHTDEEEQANEQETEDCNDITSELLDCVKRMHDCFTFFEQLKKNKPSVSKEKTTNNRECEDCGSQH